MRTTLHKAATRGGKNLGWLKTKHSFSFSDYYQPDRMNFGALRVLNDDQVEPGMGFGTHPHSNMEIISIPLEGDLEHTDSMGNVKTIKEGEIQVMSAGTGVTHSEYNPNSDIAVNFFQIWISPNKQNVEPRYDQQEIASLAAPNGFYQILSPTPNDKGVWIHQNAWFHKGDFKKGDAFKYRLKKAGNGVYAFVISGSVNVNGQELEERDGLEIEDASSFLVTAQEKAKVLLIEVPMI